MNISRRNLITRLPMALLAPAMLRADAGDTPGTVAAHRATRNTWLGALGEALPDFQAPPGRFKPYDGRERLGLPEAKSSERSFVDALTPAPSSAQHARLTLGDVARQLRLANGVTSRRGTVHLRAAPSAGALYANELYLLCEQVDGLAPGAYYYDVIGDALVPISSQRPAPVMAHALASPQAAAWLAVTSVFERYRFRYANRGYRYALIDAGHIGENFTLAARAAGLPVQRIDRFADDRIEGLLGVDGIDEAVCSVHALGAARTAADTPASVRLEPLNRALPEANDPVERYHTATRLVARKTGDETPGTHRAPRTDSPIEIEPIGTSRRLDATIHARRSTRQFRDQDLSADAIYYLARAAGAPLVHSPALTLHVIVHRGMRPGHYRYRTASHDLELLREADMRRPLQRACLGQSKAHEAAVVFLPVADFPGAVARDGERAYRHLLLDAGALGQRIYLAAEAAGLSARNLAAFIDDSLNALLELDGRMRAAVHLTVAGHGD